jgi:hypothetical protein
MILEINLPMLYLVPCPVFVLGPPGLLATVLLLDRVFVAFIERRLSLLILFIIFV